MLKNIVFCCLSLMIAIFNYECLSKVDTKKQSSYRTKTSIRKKAKKNRNRHTTANALVKSNTVDDTANNSLASNTTKTPTTQDLSNNPINNSIVNNCDDEETYTSKPQKTCKQSPDENNNSSITIENSPHTANENIDDISLSNNKSIIINQKKLHKPELVLNDGTINQDTNGLFSTLNITTTAPYAILIDCATGSIIYEKNSKERIAPSSLTKLMTIYLVFRALKEQQITLDTPFNVSALARNQSGSRSFLELNSQVRVEDLIRCIIIHSGNDASTVVAEGLCGSLDLFAEEMTKTAHNMGAYNCNFKNASGIPHDEHFASVEDIAIISLRLMKDFPEYYHYFSEKSFTINNITQCSRNRLLNNNLGVDGLKTGHTTAQGYALASSASLNGQRFLCVVNGCDTAKERAIESYKLLNIGFTNFITKTIKKNVSLTMAKVWHGKRDKASLCADTNIDLLMMKAKASQYQVKGVYESPLVAPLAKGQKVGELIITCDDQLIKKCDIVTQEEVQECSLAEKLIHNFKYILLGNSVKSKQTDKTA